MASDLNRLLDAAVFAATKHRDQRRKDSHASPYINHPLQVAQTLAEEGRVTDVELLVAAILHDTVEDTATSLSEIEQRFGSAVRDLVAEVTDDRSLDKQQRKRLQVEQTPHKSDRAKQLKLADKTCNVRDIDADHPVGWDVTRKREYLQWAQAVVAGCRGVNVQLEQTFDEAIEQGSQRIEVCAR